MIQTASTVSYSHGTSGDLNDVISRLDALEQGTLTVESYRFLGLSKVTKRGKQMINRRSDLTTRLAMRRWYANTFVQRVVLSAFVCLLALFLLSQFKSVSIWTGRWVFSAAPSGIGLTYSRGYIHWGVDVTNRSYFEGRIHYFDMPHVYPASPPGEILRYRPWTLSMPWWPIGFALALVYPAASYCGKTARDKKGFPIVAP